MNDSTADKVKLPPIAGISPYIYVPTLTFLLIVGCIFLLVGVFPAQKLRITSVPSRSALYINDRYVGASPLRYRLSTGDYKIRVSSPGFQEQELFLSFSKRQVFANLIRKTTRVHVNLPIKQESLLAYVGRETALWSNVHYDTVRTPSFDSIYVIFDELFSASLTTPQHYPPDVILSLFEKAVQEALPFMSNEWARANIETLRKHAFFQENNVQTFSTAFDDRAHYRIQADEGYDSPQKSKLTIVIDNQPYTFIYIPQTILTYPIHTYQGLGNEYHQVSQLDVVQRNSPWIQDMNKRLDYFENENGVQNSHGILDVMTKGFYILDHEVTYDEYHALVHSSQKPTDIPFLPISKVSYAETQTFLSAVNEELQKAGYTLYASLPTEFDYLAALRHLDGTIVRTALNLNLVRQVPDAVATEKNAYNLVGNLWEWTSTWYSSLPHYAQFEGPRYGAYKIIMGGAFDTSTINRNAAFIPFQRTFAREPQVNMHNIGFRFVLKPLAKYQ